jgi:hypothetical protein
VKVVNEDDASDITKVAVKQFHYIHITLQTIVPIRTNSEIDEVAQVRKT